MKRATSLLLAAMLALPAAAAEHAALPLLTRVLAGTNSRDLRGVLDVLDPDVVVTWQHGGVSRGHAGVTEYWNKAFGGTDPPVKSLSSSVIEPPQVVAFGADTAVLRGIVLDHYVLKGGAHLDLEVFWSATAVRRSDGWRIAAMHFSNNTFDNPVLSGVVRYALYGAAASAVAGALMMWLVLRKKNTTKGEQR